MGRRSVHGHDGAAVHAEGTGLLIAMLACCCGRFWPEVPAGGGVPLWKGALGVVSMMRELEGGIRRGFESGWEADEMGVMMPERELRAHWLSWRGA